MSEWKMTRERFDDLSLSVMDDLALLILAYTALRGMTSTFNNLREAQKQEAPGMVAKILKVAKTAQIELLAARQAKHPVNTVRRVRRELVGTLPAIHSIADDLAKLEESIGGNVIRTNVLIPLTMLGERWVVLEPQ